MKSIKYTIVVIELLLILPAALFMIALLVRNLQPPQSEPAHTAWCLVDWYSTHLILGLYLFLVAMPLAAFLVGSSTLFLGWHRDAEFRKAALATFNAVRPYLADLVISAATLMAGFFLAIVALHMMTN
jgi:hypothetical protein